MKNIKLLLSAVLMLFCASVQAEEITEGFEDVSIVDANGTAITGYAAGVGLSNGWKVVDGKMYLTTDYAAHTYSLWDTANSGSNSLCSNYGTSNNGFIVIPEKISGKLTFYYRRTKTSTSSSYKGKFSIYEVEQSGDTYTYKRNIKTESYTTAMSSFVKYEIDLGETPMYIAFNLALMAIDDVTYNTAGAPHETHNYATEWTSDETGHWHACTAEGYCNAPKTDFAAHDGLTCSVCGYESYAIRTLPWKEDFEGLTSGIPTGWDNSEGTTTTESYKWNYYNSYSEGKSVRFDSYNNKSGITNVLATPYIILPTDGAFELKFKVKNPAGGNYAVKIGEYGSAEVTTVLDNLTNIASWTEKTVNLSPYAGKAIKVYFCGTSNWGSGDAYLYLDDVIVKEAIAHVHEYAEAWSHNYTHHWHACVSEIGECDAPESDYAVHTLNADGICEICGYDQPYMADFEGGIPDSWTNNGWKEVLRPTHGNGTNMVYSGGYGTSNTLTTPLLTASAGDVIDIEALQEWNDEPLTLEYSLDNGATWTVGFSELPAANNTLHTLHFTAPEDGIYLLRFSGKYNYIDNVCGFKLAQIPLMDVTTTCGATKEGDAFADNFGRQTANASHTYTVKNTGAGTLTVAIASDNADFTVSESELTMGAGESKTFDVTFVHSNVYGAKAAAITIDPAYDGLATVTINATANCADPEVFFEDFENGMPSTWTTNNNGWIVITANGSEMAYAQTYKTNYLTTPLLKAVKDDVLTFDFYQRWDDEPLTFEYTLNGAEWVTVFEEKPESILSGYTLRQYEFTAPADGIYQLRFTGAYNYIDNVCGFKLAPATELEASEYPVNLNWATLCYPADVTLAEGMKAYKATDVVNGVVELVEVETTVPAYEPVLLYCAETAVLELPATSYVYNGAPSIKHDGNIFVGCLASSTLNQSNQYILQKQNDEVAFYRVNPEKPITTVPYRCYLETESTEAAKLGIAIDETTGISEVKAENRNDIYDLSGRKVEKMQKGVIYIINNHKVIIK